MTQFEIATIAAFIIAQIADVITTVDALDRKGTREGNPVIAQMMRVFGKAWPLAKIGVSVAAAAVLYYNAALPAVWGLTLLTLAIAYRNTKVGR